MQNVLNHSNKLSLCKPDAPPQNPAPKVEANGGSSPASDSSADSRLTPPESQSPLHFLADLAEQKSREEKKGGRGEGEGGGGGGLGALKQHNNRKQPGRGFG